MIIPVHNEADSLERLIDEVIATASSLRPLRLEVVVVDDGSTDGSWEAIQKAAECKEEVIGVRLRKRFGKGIALATGISISKGETVATLDGDLQDDPKHLPQFVNMLNAGYDIVSGWKRRRYDPWHKVLPSRLLNWLVRRLFGIQLHDINCGFKLYRREALDCAFLHGELYRYVILVAAQFGFRVAEIEVDHRPRLFGKTKYGLSRLLRGSLDLLTVRFLTAYGSRPNHILGGVGFCALGTGVAGLGYLALLWILGLGPIGHRPLLAYSGVLLVFGGQMVSFGILAELIVFKFTRARWADYPPEGQHRWRVRECV